MTVASNQASPVLEAGRLNSWGVFWLVLSVLAAILYFADGFSALLTAWALPEYSHGPLIPVLSGLLFLHQLKSYPPRPGHISDRWAGVAVIALAVALGALGKLAGIADVVAYAMIVWVGGLILISFGWSTGRHFWPPVLHLVFMLPLPDTLYFKLSTSLQLISSELGVWFLGFLAVPVFLEGNIIDFGTFKLHVAEACSGLRYLFPIMSFSYIFALLYKGPKWQKLVLLLLAAPLAVLMNSVRIAAAGLLAQKFGTEWLVGFTHFFEGWVIFLSCIVILFGVTWVMMRYQNPNAHLREALELDFDGLIPQAMRIGLVQPSKALILSTLIVFAATAVFEILPDREGSIPERERFAAFQPTLGDWQQVGTHRRLDPDTEAFLAADDYHNVTLSRGEKDEPGIGLFMAWYANQSSGGVHSPEICLPGAGWEIAWLERTNIASELGQITDININRAIIQRGEVRMMVIYWFEQKGRRIAWDFAAKMWLIVDGVRTGRTDGGLVRLTTLIAPSETDAMAEARLMDALIQVQDHVPHFIPE